MKRFIFTLVLAITLVSVLKSQKFYSSTGGEFIFSNAIVEAYGTEVPTNTRFTLFYHMETNYHYDFSRFMGIYSGIGIRNIGLIIDEDIKYKYRSYSAGIPFAFKVGSLSRNFFIYSGAEYEMMFHFKQKEFEGDQKTKESEWFSDKVNRFIPSFFCGIQFPNTMNIRFKMYLDDFLNTNYKEKITDNIYHKPFENMKSQIYYISLSFYFRNKKIKEKFNEKKEIFVRL